MMHGTLFLLAALLSAPGADGTVRSDTFNTRVPAWVKLGGFPPSSR